MPGELGLGLEFKTNTGQKCFVADGFVFIKKRKKLWNIGTMEQKSRMEARNIRNFQTKPF
jgi:hypothetical protein